MPDDFRVGGWLVHRQLNQFEKDGETRTLEARSMELLYFFAQHPGEVVTKERIINAVWPNTFVGDEALFYSLSELRKALGDNAKDPTYIQTIPRRGYRLIAPVEAAPAPALESKEFGSGQQAVEPGEDVEDAAKTAGPRLEMGPAFKGPRPLPAELSGLG
jgi:DNA-binding winged helix-turn-helix (wHTH) protein